MQVRNSLLDKEKIKTFCKQQTKHAPGQEGHKTKIERKWGVSEQFQITIRLSLVYLFLTKITQMIIEFPVLSLEKAYVLCRRENKFSKWPPRVLWMLWPTEFFWSNNWESWTLFNGSIISHHNCITPQSSIDGNTKKWRALDLPDWWFHTSVG